ncbi:hypothetical protein DW667_03350 [Coprococcus sp. AM25-15LB]|nr:hypothetical protein DW667_03350 [Coprococcus sp. AM25-15LB]RJW09824.1 hypothetical protein DW686_03350 [Coprococcus sp. AM25-4LB]
MKEQMKEIIFSLLNIAILVIIFTGLSDPADGATLAIIIIGIILVMAYFSIGNIFVKFYLHTVGIEEHEKDMRFSKKLWILSFAAYILTSRIIGCIMSVVMIVGKFLIALCICIATGKLIEGGLHDLWLSKQYANIVVDVYDFCTSITDRIIEFIMRGEAKIIGATKEEFFE